MSRPTDPRHKAKGLKNKKKKGKRVTFVLSERDAKILAAAAAKAGVHGSLMAKRLLHLQLQQAKPQEPAEAVAPNQLSLFDSIQIDIFHNTSRTKEDK